MSTNRNYKDSVFTKLFSETDKILELYNALTNESYDASTEIEINTLEGILFLDRMNDISFTIGGKTVVLIEHMSNPSQNLPLRCLMYIARVYEKIIDNEAVYRQKLMKIPAPEFIVLYNGKDEFPDEKELRLSAAFYEKPEQEETYGNLELTVRMLNINYGHNNEKISRSNTLQGYVIFVHKVREGIDAGLDRTDAITGAIKYCKKHGILQPFLSNHASEVHNMLTTEFNIDIARKVWQEEAREDGLEEGVAKGLEEGVAKGRAKGRLEERKEILALLESGKSLDDIKALLGSASKPL